LEINHKLFTNFIILNSSRGSTPEKTPLELFRTPARSLTGSRKRKHQLGSRIEYVEANSGTTTSADHHLNSSAAINNGLSTTYTAPPSNFIAIIKLISLGQKP
jgi:hypothetical protein